MLIIDRFENGAAVCEDGLETLSLPRTLLPAEAREGDVIRVESGVYSVDKAATEHRRKAAAQRLERLLAHRNEAK